MGKLVLNLIRAHVQHLIEQGPRDGPESVASHHVLGDTQTSHCSQNGIVAHGALAASGAQEDKYMVNKRRRLPP
jgi:hypothetical protein